MVGMFNFDAVSAQVTANFSAIGGTASMNVHDLVSHMDLGRSTATFTATLATHASRMLKLAP